jgi:exodeoxyribonuclease III
MKVVTLNIRHGGGKRAAALVRWLLAANGDVLVLTEWKSSGPGREISEALVHQDYYVNSFANEGANGILVASRSPISSTDAAPAGHSRGSLRLVTVEGSPIRILAAYFPQSYAKAAFFASSMRLANEYAGVPFLLIGDLNTGDNSIDRTMNGVPFHCADDFQALSAAGLRDLWREQHGEDAREFSWSSPKNSFRIDHAFGSAALRAADCRYDREPRDCRITDHSALIVCVD